MNKVTWNSRFHISDSRNNNFNHEYYREYFGKPSNHQHKKLLPPSNPSNFPNLSSTLDKISNRMPKLKQFEAKRKKSLEEGWNPYFQTRFSKDNQYFYKSYRDYFDYPKIYKPDIPVVCNIPKTSRGSKSPKIKKNISIISSSSRSKSPSPKPVKILKRRVFKQNFVSRK